MADIINDTEIWKPIRGYEGVYEISTFGRIKTLSRSVNSRYGWRTIKEKIRKIGRWANTYPTIILSKNGVNSMYLVHRVVAETFIPNILNKPEINHRDGNKGNPCVSNLEWATSSENKFHSHRTGLQVVPTGESHHLFGKNGQSSNSAKLVLDQQTGIYYESVKEASAAKGIGRTWLSRMLCGSNKNKTDLIFV